VHGAGAIAGRPRLDALAGGPDVVWMPAPAPVGVSRSVPLVLTVHDLSWVERPGDFTAYERLWHRTGRLRRLAERATAVVAVSHATRSALLQRWGLDPARVHVVHPGVPHAAPPAARAAGVDDRPHLLFVGALEPRKGVDVLAHGFARARREGLRAGLVVVGDGRLRGRLAGLPGVRVLPAADPGTLAKLYADATALVMPSYHEGFGFPPLEAALAGTPSVVSDLPVFAETLGDAALRVPAGDAPALGRALLRVEADPSLRERLARDAAAAAARFSWERAAAVLHGILVASTRP
jgi:glycosyltransferase involved in cell wall biosynthesis